MHYLALIHGDEQAFAAMPAAQVEQLFEAYAGYGKDLENAGVLRGGGRLQPSSAGAKVAVRDGERQVTEGPFTEPREQLTGYYLIECGSREEALKWAADCPGAGHGTVDVRPVASD